MTDETVELLVGAAQDGLRVTCDGKTLWAGLGNRAGLHDYAYTLLAERWKKSGERFVKKLRAIAGGVVEVYEFKNTSRDRGRWRCVGRYET